MLPARSLQLAVLLCLMTSACSPRQTAEDTTSVHEAHTVASSAPADPRLAALLDAHNARRAEHCAAPLEWSDDLAAVARSWAEDLARRDCAFEHNQTAFGENLWAGTAESFSPQQIVDMWHRELGEYDFAAGRFGMDTGHFTQLVWRSSRRVGCGSSTCGGMDLWVCNYDPPGNVQGEFGENVLPVTCR